MFIGADQPHPAGVARVVEFPRRAVVLATGPGAPAVRGQPVFEKVGGAVLLADPRFLFVAAFASVATFYLWPEYERLAARRDGDGAAGSGAAAIGGKVKSLVSSGWLQKRTRVFVERARSAHAAERLSPTRI